jgi:protein tyrosine phosphatase (PTP) superfamily phosphohydrolase (DUF442 family)
MNDLAHIRNWRRFDRRITTSGQPTEEQLRDLQKLDVTHVINLALHTHEDALRDEAASVAGLGMTYIHIPIDFERPTNEGFHQFCAALAEIGDGSVHVHCIVNARVTAFMYRYQKEVMGVAEAPARAFMDTVWRPGGVWAAFIGEPAAADRAHQWAGHHY